MPIERCIEYFRRTAATRKLVGFLLTGLVLVAAACAGGAVSSSPASAVVVQQEQPPVTQATTIPLATVVASQPPTLTAVPTTAIELQQEQPTITAITAVSPTLPLPTAPAPTQALVVATLLPSPTTNDAAEVPTLPTGTPAATVTEEAAPYFVYDLGLSSRGFPLTAHRFNDGERHIVIVGGIHGGYEWNTVMLAYELIDYFREHPGAVPDSITLTVIPVANPDGLELVSGRVDRFTIFDLQEDTFPGRFNGNDVDLNRNWDCQWAPTAEWRDREISGGANPFSEPETIRLRDYFLQQQPEAVVFLHSAANGVFASGCPNTHQPSMALAQIYGEAAGYPVYERFSAYEVTGDAGDWLSKQDIASISVELINHQNTDLDQNLAGILAVLKHYG